MTTYNHWQELLLGDVNIEDGPRSFPYNPMCSIGKECSGVHQTCSKNMKFYDLCIWHHYRMEREPEVKSCGCGKKWKIATGDWVSRWFCRTYYQDVTAVSVSFDGFFCCGSCQNANSDIYACGDMKICADCKDLHDEL